MNLLSVENVSKSYGERVLFSEVTFGIEAGQKVAFVAKNGTGKSSLLRIIMKEDVPDTGVVTTRKEIKVSCMSQEPDFNQANTIAQEVLQSDNDQLRAIAAYEKALINPEDTEAYQAAFDEMDRMEAWDYEQQVKQILGKLKIHDTSRVIKTLSGGEEKRVALAKVLIEHPDLLILDEPTNHLDLDMIEWLEGYLKSASFGLLMVTHDRYFLENVCEEILELDEGEIYAYQGSFQYYLEHKAHRREVALANVDKAKNQMRKEQEWMRRQPKARTTKSKARIDAFYELEKEAKKNLKEDSLELNIKMTRLGSKIIEIRSLCKAYGDKKLVEKFTYSFKNGEKVGIIGDNGSGKSTLLKMLTGVVEPDAGKIVLGETVRFGHYTQEGIQLKEDKRVIEVIKDIAEYIPVGKKGNQISAAQMLEKFLFSRDHQYTFVRKLSGGERKRLYLLTILMANPNFLILDEPTNDLDLVTLNVLEEFLREYTGCLIIVSHDRYFMDEVVDHLFLFEGEGVIRDFGGNYTQYREERQEKKVAKYAKPKKEEAPKVEKEKTKLTYNENKEFESLSGEIEALENRKAEIATLFESPGEGEHDFDALSKELSQISSDLEIKEFRWLELSEFV